jgi:uncharacterized membrane protein YphA (DoxX/SURF4 family)
MKRKNLSSDRTLLTCTLGVLLVGGSAVVLTAVYPIIQIIMAMITLVALAGIGQRWQRLAKRRRRALDGEQLQI